MENKIQELTEKIYREGVEKGNEEAQRLVSNAREEAAKILEEARKEAEAIVAAARKSATETAENTQSEIYHPCSRHHGQARLHVRKVFCLRWSPVPATLCCRGWRYGRAPPRLYRHT